MLNNFVGERINSSVIVMLVCGSINKGFISCWICDNSVVLYRKVRMIKVFVMVMIVVIIFVVKESWIILRLEGWVKNVWNVCILNCLLFNVGK